MKPRDTRTGRFAALMLALAALPALAQTPLPASGGKLPSGLHSDQVAWEHFANVVMPATNGRVAFETWASDENIYTDTPSWPGDAAIERKQLRQGMQQRALHPHAMANPSGGDGVCGPVQDAAAGNFPLQNPPPAAQPCYAEEVRRNLASYRYLVQNQLNTQAGLAAAYQKAQAGWRVALPEDAVSVKANWLPVDTLIEWLARNGVRMTAPQVRSQYYTTFSDGSSYALVALHISSKELPNWVWASFEHRLNPGRCDTMGCNDSYGSTLHRVAPSKHGSNQQYAACTRSAPLKKLMQAKNVAAAWNNYCLKATEIAYLAPSGAPLMNGNSFTERVSAGAPITRSSCIGCHASAGFGRDGRPYTKLLASMPMGQVKLPADIVANDFSWGILAINAIAPEQAKAIPNNLDRTRVAARR